MALSLVAPRFDHVSSTLRPIVLCRPPPLADSCRRFLSVSCSSSARDQRSRARLAAGAGGNESYDYYKLLHLSPENSGADEVKRAYRRMSLRYHPDVCDPSMKEESTRMFVEVNAAYKTLSDPILRMEYDYDLGLVDFGRQIPGLRTEYGAKKIWENQITGLKRRSAQQGRRTTWGSKMRDRKSDHHE